jgi:putative ABC transport system permease protein
MIGFAAMSVLMTLRVALKALARNKLRTALTMLGMIIGVGAVIAMIALGTGAQAAIEAQIRSAGTNMIMIYPGSATVGGARQGAGTSSRLTAADAKVLRELPDLDYVSEGLQSQQQVVAGAINWRSAIVGVNVDYVQIKSWPLTRGSFFTDVDVASTAKVCTLGANVAQILFGDEDPTGREIRLRNHVFKVLGVMGPKGASTSGQNQDDQIFVPYTTLMRRIQGTEFLQYILVSARAADQIRPTADAVTAALRVAHEIEPGMDDDFRVQTQDDLVAARTETTQTMTSLLAGIAAVSLLVGGIGIMNIMLVSVTERTREIGLRLAIGARGSDVLMQFLVEAVVISLVGGFAGIGVGYGVSEIIRVYQQWPTLIPADSVFTAVAFSASVGIFFGFYPARKAAALDPIEALRFE